MRVTQKEIARAAGVHPSTVCLALANRPEIPKETRKAIAALAQKLGYKRDPMLSALAAYRRTAGKTSFQGGLAWLVNSEGGFNWKLPPEYRDYHAGAKERAAELGYGLELIDLNEFKANPARLLGVLGARNISGVLVCPQPQAHTLLNLDFSKIAAVTLGYTVQSPALHMASSNHFSSMREIMRQLRTRGYQRIGCAIPATHDDRLDGNYMAAYLLETAHVAAKHRIPAYDQPPQLGSVKRWLNHWRPDAVIIPHYGFPEIIAALRIPVPKKLGVAVVSLAESTKEFCGIDEDSKQIGRVAVALVASLAERGEYGLPARPQRVLVRGVWREGRSLLPPSIV